MPDSESSAVLPTTTSTTSSILPDPMTKQHSAQVDKHEKSQSLTPTAAIVATPSPSSDAPALPELPLVGGLLLRKAEHPVGAWSVKVEQS